MYTYRYPKFLAVAQALLVASVFLTGCQTAKTPSQEQDAMAPAEAESTAGMDQQEGAAVGRESMTIQIDGADASHEGDTLTLTYPVLQDKNNRLPDWAINPAMGGVVGSVGVASVKGLGTREQLDEARLSGRLELASMLETRLQTVGRSALEENLMANAEGRGENSRRNTLGVDRDILDIVLAGSRQRALWFDPESGECFVWMVLDGGVLDKALHYVEDEVSVFIANTPIAVEYAPARAKLEPPTVVVEAAEPPPPPPKEPVEQLEENLKPIATVPINSSDS
ncbi:hypothetical protein [Pontiella agarivorans]|uniref:Lipoprotein n=1 Tax=Pontiella agarivorans TaxID=3038953 RepID=A0ABU5MXJ6_9BACT|nr:hypothetical protein [Pontiella agarivorans]MDZ8118932.1 hypothetical protein [Pontiella agarivorans]